MPINLAPEQETWTEAHVANGDFASVEEAARQFPYFRCMSGAGISLRRPTAYVV